MRMCDCMPNHIKYSFRCKKRRNLSLLGLRLNCSLEFTIIHFWLYMIFLGVVIAFLLKSVGCYLQHRNAKDGKNKVEFCETLEISQPSCPNPEPPNDCFSYAPSNCYIPKQCGSNETLE